jgi:type IV secretion system protein VirB10
MSERNVVLMEKGTVVTGSYDSKIATGQKRLMALTVVAYTPNDCVVPLGGPMADATGRTGLEGEVRNHTLEKFGFAFLLSGIDVASGLLQAAMQQNGGNNTYLSLNSGNGLTGLAQEILRENMNIKPTIEPHRGDDVMIWLPGPAPIDFSDCYKLVTRN